MKFAPVIDKLFNWCFCFLSILFFPTLGFSHSGNSCENINVKPFNEKPPLYIYESPTYEFLGKHWSTSNELKAYFDQQKSLLNQLKDQALPKDVIATLRLASVGDIMRLSQDQSNFVLDGLKKYLDTVDVLNGNLETLISPKYPVPPDSLIQMNSAPSVITSFRDGNQRNYFSLISTANNHTFDYPDDALKDTLELLNHEGIAQSGVRTSTEDKPYQLLDKNGIRIGYYAITTFVNEVQTLKKSKLHLNPMLTGIESIPFRIWKKGCEVNLSDTHDVLHQMEQDAVDVKIISIHWGLEHYLYPRPAQLDIAHRLVEQGADIIVGSHPHVAQPAEVCFVNGYEQFLDPTTAETQRSQGCTLRSRTGQARKAMIYYSLGNFTSYTPSFFNQAGVIGELTVVKQNSDKGPIVDWHQPKYVLTYDHVEAPPHGERQLDLLTNHIGNKCSGHTCSTTVDDLVSILDRHLYGKSLSTWEELKVIAITTYTTVQNIIPMIQREISLLLAN